MRNFFVALAIACTFSCAPKTINVSVLDLRVAAAPEVWASLSPQDRALVSSGRMETGMAEGAVYLVRGLPLLWWNTTINGNTCRALLYAESNTVNNAVYTCGGIVRRQTQVAPKLPCWRISTVSKRIVADLAYFESVPLERQWEIVVGMLRRGQAERDVGIAFGKPFNKGSESREDGSDVGTSVYLADGGDTYGLYVNFINNRVVGWKIPADRRLTPQAQQRRLEATEQRLMSQLKEMDAKAEQRHRDSVELLDQVLAGQRNMRQNLSETAAALATSYVGDLVPNSISPRAEEPKSGYGPEAVQENCRLPERSTGKRCKTNDDCHNGTECFGDGTTLTEGNITHGMGKCRGKEVIVLKCE